MGFLRQLFGRGSAGNLELRAIFFTRLRDDAAVQVVGEAYRQKSVASARPPGPNDLPPGVPPPPAGQYKALLWPEPTNQYDPNAIAVHLWAGSTWTMSGYLSRADAVAYGPVMHRIATIAGPGRPAIACDAAMVRISLQSDHPFRSNPISRFGGFRSPAREAVSALT